MNKAAQASQEIRTIEELNTIDSPVHKMSPLSKLILTVVYITCVASFGRYDIYGLFVMILLPLIGYVLSTIPVSLCFRKMRFVLPAILLVGIANPFLDRDIAVVIGRVPVSFGMISMLTLLMKGAFSIMASFLLIATTPIDDLCKSLRRIHVPKIMVSLLLLTYRYISLFLDEVSVMTDCYSLRAPGQKGIQFSAWGSFLGGLIIRSEGKASRNYDCMMLRGFNGDFDHAVGKGIRTSWLFAVILITFSIGMRLYNLPAIIGSVFVR